jgi:hypothetical protein
LCERSRQYSVSVTLGEGSGETNTITDPAPARSMQLNTEFEADANKNPSDKGNLYFNIRKLERQVCVIDGNSYSEICNVFSSEQKGAVVNHFFRSRIAISLVPQLYCI